MTQNFLIRKTAIHLFILVMCIISNTVNAQQIIHTGISFKDVKHMFPNAVLSVEEQTDSILTAAETINGLSGKWHFKFKRNKLEHALFDVYDDSLSQKEFDRFLRATKKTIAAYSKKMGKPDSMKNGTMVFRDPYKKIHWGYRVKEARWNNYKGSKVKVAFVFLGGKGIYKFIFSINCFDKDYPYFE